VALSLGVDVGTTYTAAAVCRTDQSGQRSTEAIGLGTRTAVAASVVFIGTDGHWLVGDAAERRAHDRPELVVREFKRRIGDPVPLVVGDARPTAETLAAGVVSWVVDRVTEQEGAAPTHLTLTHPASWGSYKLDLVRAALQDAGLTDVSFVSEPVAAAAHYAAQARVPTGAAVAVYDLGGGTFDAAVVRKIDDHRFQLLGSPGGLDRVGGSDFDEAVMGHVQRTARLPAIDLHDDVAVASMLRLRRECIEAKEALSDDTDATIPVLLPELTTRVRLVRAELEELVHDRLVETVDTLVTTIASTGLAAADLDAVLLVGGSSRIPLVCQLVSERLDRPVVVDADPKTAVALGAAIIGATEAPAPATVRSAPIVAAPTATGSDEAVGGDDPVRKPQPSKPRAVAVVPAHRGRHRVGRAAIAGAAAGLAIVAGATIALLRPFDSPDAPALAIDESPADGAVTTSSPPMDPSEASTAAVTAGPPAASTPTATVAQLAPVVAAAIDTAPLAVLGGGISPLLAAHPGALAADAVSTTSSMPLGAAPTSSSGVTTTVPEGGTDGAGPAATPSATVAPTGTTPATTRPRVATSSPTTTAAATVVAPTVPPATQPPSTSPPTTLPPTTLPPASSPPTTDPPAPTTTQTSQATDAMLDSVTTSTAAPGPVTLLEIPTDAGVTP
jgi:molecular chaperone DnaK